MQQRQSWSEVLLGVQAFSYRQPAPDCATFWLTERGKISPSSQSVIRSHCIRHPCSRRFSAPEYLSKPGQFLATHYLRRPDSAKPVECHRGVTRFLVGEKLAVHGQGLMCQEPLGSSSSASNLEATSHATTAVIITFRRGVRK